VFVILEVSFVSLPRIQKKIYVTWFEFFSESEKANVNVSLRLLFAVVRLSSVCLSSVMFVRLTQVVQIFGNISMALGTLAIH